MNTAFEKLIQHLESMNVGYWSRTEDSSICAEFRGEVGTYRLLAKVNSEDNLFQVFGHCPIRVPLGARPAVAETIARANHGLKIGKFEFDFDEGEIRYQAAQILTDDNLEDSTIHRMMGTTMAMLNTYLPAVLSVIYGNELPKDAIRHAEPARPTGETPEVEERDGEDSAAEEEE